MIYHHAKFFTMLPGITPPSTVFLKILANNSVCGLYDKNSIGITFNFIILSRTIQEMILIHICCSFVKMRQKSAMPIFNTSYNFLKFFLITDLTVNCYTGTPTKQGLFFGEGWHTTENEKKSIGHCANLFFYGKNVTPTVLHPYKFRD